MKRIITAIYRSFISAYHTFKYYQKNLDELSAIIPTKEPEQKEKFTPPNFFSQPEYKYVCGNCLQVAQECLDFISINCPENFDVYFTERDLFNFADIIHRSEWKEIPEYYSKNLLKGTLQYLISLDQKNGYLAGAKIRDILNNNSLTKKQ